MFKMEMLNSQRGAFQLPWTFSNRLTAFQQKIFKRTFRREAAELEFVCRSDTIRNWEYLEHCKKQLSVSGLWILFKYIPTLLIHELLGSSDLHPF